MVATFIYHDVEFIKDHETLETLTLEEVDGQTTITINVRHDSRESRDGHVNSGMESGAGQSYERLAGLLATMA